MWKCLGEKCEKCVDYAVNTLDYADISTVNKTDDKVRTTVKRKALQSLTQLFIRLHIIFANFDMFDLFMAFVDRYFFNYMQNSSIQL